MTKYEAKYRIYLGSWISGMLYQFLVYHNYFFVEQGKTESLFESFVCLLLSAISTDPIESFVSKYKRI